jgi:hypothetical protein
MININIKRALYHLRYRYPLREVVTIVAVTCIVVWFIWGSVQAMQKNYELKRTLENRKRDAALIELETKTSEYEQRYLQSTEYKKLAARKWLNLADPGEKLLILPPNTPGIDRDEADAQVPAPAVKQPSNLSQWLTFLLGGNVRDQ